MQSLIVVLGLALVFSPDTLSEGLSLAPGQDWLDDLLFAVPLGFLAYTGLETVANLAEEAREPGRTLPRSLFSAIGLVVLLTVLVAMVGVTAFPATDGSTALGDEWLEAPLVGIVTAFDGELPATIVDVLRDRRRPLRSAHPDDGGDDVDLRLRAARALDGDARDAAARDRPARAADARLTPGDRRDHDRRDRRRPDQRRARGRRDGSSRAPTPSASSSPSRSPSSP